MKNKPNTPNAIVLEPAAMASRIFVIHGQKVMLDFHLAELYGTSTKALVQAVKRNSSRFPLDFMFQLSTEEHSALRSQFVTSKEGRGGNRYSPYAFTEHGIAMLSSVLRSPRAIQMNIFIIRAFVKIRELLATNQDMALRLAELERNQDMQGRMIADISDIVQRLAEEPIKPLGKLGFETGSPRED